MTSPVPATPGSPSARDDSGTALAVVVGGMNVDLVGVSAAAMVAGTSNPGRMLVKPGGVGRNVAENIARLGSAVHLVAGVGQDALGRLVTDATREAGVRLDHLLPAAATGTYTALIGNDGELVAAVADMRASDDLTPETLASAQDVLARAQVVVLDANLPTETLLAAQRLSTGRVVVEPVSVPKAARLRPLLTQGVSWFALTPNLDELEALTGIATPQTAVAFLHEAGVEHVWVRRGREGSTLFPRGGEPITLAALPAEVVDVTGAGDAMLGAFVHGLLAGQDLLTAGRWGHAAACLTIEDEATVRPDLTHDLILQTLAERTPR